MEAIVQAISEATGQPFQLLDRRSVSGGCIHEAAQWVGEAGQRYFVKRNHHTAADMFRAETEGLHALAATQTVRVPNFICHGKMDTQAYLVLEWLELRSATEAASTLLGEQLAAMHRCTADGYGWHRDNYIGKTPQPNGWLDDWVTFFRQQRLLPQLRMAERQGLQLAGAERLLERIGDLFDNYQPEPSLLHGDLWGGNAACDAEGNPVLFDPATYYGDRETDLAFTEMFGGFSASFYAAYQASWPLDAGYAVRKRLYNCYHELNHFNLFGGGYGDSAAQSVAWLLRQL